MQLSFAITAGAIAGLGGAAHADSIRLHRSVVVDAASPIVLKDVAKLSGGDAVALANVVLVETPLQWSRGATWRALELTEIRGALLDNGASLGRLALSGSACIVRLQLPASPPSQTTSPPTAREHNSPPLAGTVRAALLRELQARYGAEAGSLRATFAADDPDFLDAMVYGRRVIAEGNWSDASARLTLNVRIMAAGQIAVEQEVRADVELLQTVLVLQSDVARDEPISPRHVACEKMWISPSGRLPFAHINDVLGKLADSRLQAGTILRHGHLVSPILIERGQLVEVLIINGACRITATARAQQDARLSEPVELKMSRDRDSFIGTVDGPGSAIIVQ